MKTPRLNININLEDISNMAYEDKFRSVREQGPAPGTSPDPNRVDPGTLKEEDKVEGTPEVKVSEPPLSPTTAPDETPATGRDERIREQIKARKEREKALDEDMIRPLTKEEAINMKPIIVPTEQPAPEAPHNLGGFPLRSIQAVFSDMRRVLADKDNLLEGDKERINSLLLSLISEGEIYSERMDAALGDRNAYKHLKQKYDNLKEHYNHLQKRVDEDSQ